MTQFNPDLIQINASSKQTGSARDAKSILRGGVADKLLNTQRPIFETAKFGDHNNANNTITTSAAVGKIAEAVASAGGLKVITGKNDDTSSPSKTDATTAEETKKAVAKTTEDPNTPKQPLDTAVAQITAKDTPLQNNQEQLLGFKKLRDVEIS